MPSFLETGNCIPANGEGKKQGCQDDSCEGKLDCVGVQVGKSAEKIKRAVTLVML
jgi:hypothetical protein